MNDEPIQIQATAPTTPTTTPEQERARIQQIMRDLAAQVMRQEQAAPGLQDPELLRWAAAKLKGEDTPVPAASPAPAPPVSAPAPPAPQPQRPLATTGSEGVLHIQRQPAETTPPAPTIISPTVNPGQSRNTDGNYTQDNGEQ
jgi:hypothetical protein